MVKYPIKVQNYMGLLNGNHESQKVLHSCAADTKRPWIQAQNTIPSKAFNHHRWGKQGIL